VKAVLLMHDIDCYGFLLRKGSEYALYAVDTYDIPYRFPKLKWLLLGIDYDEYTLWNSALNHELPLSLAERISNSHMSLERAKRFLARQEHENLVIMHYGQWLNLELVKETGGLLWTELK
jgi:phosphoribosyl 1,2-cyclic phosphodiesterase